MTPEARDLLKSGASEFGLPLTPAQVDQFDHYAEELKKWNRKVNLTAITSDADIAIKHFVDSLSLHRFIPAGSSLLDIGSGAGFPCLPLKIVRPDLRVTSIDAVGKKIIFQRNVARLLRMSHFQAMHGRGEQLQPKERGQFDIVISRAFSDIPTFAGMAAPLLKEDGTIIAMKGREGRHEADAAAEFLKGIGLRVTAVEEFDLPLIHDGRSLILIGKKRGENH